MVSLVNSHTNAPRIGWHMWEIDLDLPLGCLQGGSTVNVGFPNRRKALRISPRRNARAPDEGS